MRYFYLVLLFLLVPQLLPVNAQQSHLDTAISYIGIKELTGNNDGPVVEMFLKSVGLQKGNPWCAAFVYYCIFRSNTILNPSIRSGRAKDYIFKSSIGAKNIIIGKNVIKKGDLIVWTRGNTPFGHIEISAEDWNGIKGKTVGGNTSPGKGSQYNGDGVYIKIYTIQPGNYFRIQYITKIN